jgi:hypothetical protein
LNLSTSLFFRFDRSPSRSPTGRDGGTSGKNPANDSEFGCGTAFSSSTALKT